MKFICEECKKLINEEETIIAFCHALAVGTSIYAYCNECFKKLELKKP